MRATATSTHRRPRPHLSGYIVVVLAIMAIVVAGSVLMMREMDRGLGRSSVCTSTDELC